MNFLWTSYELLMNFLLTAYELLMNFLWNSYELLMNFLWTSYELLMNFLWNSYELLMNYLWTSYVLLRYLLQTSYKLVINFLWNFHYPWAGMEEKKFWKNKIKCTQNDTFTSLCCIILPLFYQMLNVWLFLFDANVPDKLIKITKTKTCNCAFLKKFQN